MKKVSLLLVIVSSLFISSCKTVSLDDQIDNIFEFVQNDDYFQEMYGKAQSLKIKDRLEYFTYVIAEEAGIEDILVQTYKSENSRVSNKNIVAELPVENELNQTIVISSDINDVAGCVAAIEVVNALKNAKVKQDNTIRLLLYNGQSGYNEYRKTSRSKKEAHLFNLDLSDTNYSFDHFQITERNDIYETISVIVPQYLEKHKAVTVTFDDESDTTYAINPHYRLITSKEGDTSFDFLVENTSLAAAMVCILN